MSELLTQSRDDDQARRLVDAIGERARGLGPLRLMEVCGSHTMVIRRSGIDGLLPEGIELISGPGCPVCVTTNQTLDHAIALAGLDGVTLLTYGDLLRVPGSRSSLAAQRAAGGDVRVVYSALDALRLARSAPDRQVVFLGVGFETTAPTVAAVLLEAARDTPNLSVLVAHKLVPPALAALGQRADFAIDGFLLPGHVSTIIGSEAYQPVLAKAGLPGVVAGFEPLDVLLAIWMLLDQIAEGRVGVEVEYRGAVRPGGNRRALEILEQVFDPVDADWRGLGRIPGSGLALKAAFARLDAAGRFDVNLEPSREPAGCCCGQVLVGALAPPGCPLFATACTPDDPVGPCMVSSEGSCAAHYLAGPRGPVEGGRAG